MEILMVSNKSKKLKCQRVKFTDGYSKKKKIIQIKKKVHVLMNGLNGKI
jgi:hypothetical protein